MSRALFISDLHLSVERPGPNEQFFRFLHEEAARADALYILGDLFEYWIGDDGIEEDPLGRQVVRALRVLSRAGVAVFLMVGNRDFLMGAKFCEASGARFLDDPRVVEIDGKPVLLMHGDTLCTDDREYQVFRAQVRDPAWQRSTLARPLAERLALAASLREQSDLAKAGKTMAIMDVATGAVEEAFRACGRDLLVHGHTHRPARHVHLVDGRERVRWVLPDWYGTGGYLEATPKGLRAVAPG